ncbi:hypothetical protein YTPLAS18_13730 [Nitrospira sp.]|nr:hypothetical protein YTPLAS18_13730 [Nitrospira sp.]
MNKQSRGDRAGWKLDSKVARQTLSREGDGVNWDNVDGAGHNGEKPLVPYDVSLYVSYSNPPSA